MVLSADRYVAVCHPISSPRFRTGLIAKIVSLSAWLVSALLMLPVFLYATTITRQDGGETCNIFWSFNSSLTGEGRASILNEQTAFTFYSFIFGFLGPLGFILIFYVLVIIKLRSVGPQGGARSTSRRRSHRKVTKLVLTVITVYIICWLPHWVTQIALIRQDPGHNQVSVPPDLARPRLADCMCAGQHAGHCDPAVGLSPVFKLSHEPRALRISVGQLQGKSDLRLHH